MVGAPEHESASSKRDVSRAQSAVSPHSPRQSDSPLDSEPVVKWVKDLDKLELIHQAIAYEKSDNLDLSGIIENTQAKVKTDAGKELLRELEDERNAYIQKTADKSPK